MAKTSDERPWSRLYMSSNASTFLKPILKSRFSHQNRLLLYMLLFASGVVLRYAGAKNEPFSQASRIRRATLSANAEEKTLENVSSPVIFQSVRSWMASKRTVKNR